MHRDFGESTFRVNSDANVLPNGAVVKLFRIIINNTSK